MADLTPDRLQELRRIAEAATPGPYEVVGLAGIGGPYALRMTHRSGRTWYGVEAIKRREDAEYFAAMNRNTVLALLDEIEELRRGVEEWKSVASAQAELHDEAEEYAERLVEALSELITWIPSADIYLRLGFDPEAPMRALKQAKLALGRGG